MPLWVGDFLAKTTSLDAKETGAYMLILMAMWTHGGYLPDDMKKLQRVARCGRDWPRVWGALAGYFETGDGLIWQRRLVEEMQKVASKRAVNAQHGALGGRAKALKRKEAPLANATVSLKQSESYREDSVSNDTDANASDFAKTLFDRGVAYLGRHGVSERQARSVIGKWRKDHDDTEVFEAFSECSRAGVTEPVAWITARLKPRDSPVDMDAIWKEIEEGTVRQ